MDRSRLPPLVGIVASLLVAALLVAPYLLVRSEPGSTITAYYRSGAFNPLVTGVFALVVAMILAAGRQRRTDPALAAGVGLALGTLVFLILALWAVTVPTGLVTSMNAPAAMTSHRWLVAGCALVTPIASLAWARTMGIL